MARVAISGAAGAIGARLAAAFAADGAEVHLLDLDARVAQVADEVGGVAHVCDLTDEDAVAAAVVHDRLDCLVNAAGQWPLTPFDQLTRAEWDRQMAVNVTSAFLTTRAHLPALRLAAGAVVNLTSTTAFTGGPPGLVAYVTAKAAIIGLTRGLARELGPDGIRVNAVAPGFVDTPGNRAVFGDDAIAATAARRALARAEMPDDVVGVVRFLASPAAQFVTGQTVVVDGGAVMG